MPYPACRTLTATSISLGSCFDCCCLMRWLHFIAGNVRQTQQEACGPGGPFLPHYTQQ